MDTNVESEPLTASETQTDSEGQAHLIIRCKDKNGVFLPCFAFALNRAELEKVYAFPLEFIIW